MTKIDKAARSAEAWDAFISAHLQRIETEVREVARGSSDGSIRMRLQGLRRQHHVILIANRVRAAAVERGALAPISVSKLAEEILDKPGRFSRGGNGIILRTADEERYAVSARVAWHKLMKRAGIKAPGSPRLNHSPSAAIRTANRKLAALRSGTLPPREIPQAVSGYLIAQINELLVLLDSLPTAQARSLGPLPEQLAAFRDSLSSSADEL